MKKEAYSITILADAPSHVAFDCINNVAAWWTSDLQGQSRNMNDTFTVYFGEVHVSAQTITELLPDKKIVWLVTESMINFVNDKKEWLNTYIVFDITPKGNQTEIRFTHIGLTPDLECFSACSNAWADYIIESLLPLINTGVGKPNGKTP